VGLPDAGFSGLMKSGDDGKIGGKCFEKKFQVADEFAPELDALLGRF